MLGSQHIFFLIVKKSRSLKNRDDQVHQLIEFSLRIQGKKIVPAQENEI
jgi:hypothetical protein